MKTITRKDWEKAKSWEKAVATHKKQGYKAPHRVSEEIYNEFLECLPPAEMGKTRETFKSLPLPVQEYFLVGEPQSFVNGREVYATFCKALDKHWFIGYTHKS